MSEAWREVILQEFVPHVARLTLAADPDALLTEEGVQRELYRRGFELIEYDDPIVFRYTFETQYQARWEPGDGPDLIVFVRAHSLDGLPFDILHGARQLTFSLSHLLPDLSYNAIAALDRSDLGMLFQAVQKQHPESLGENATQDFVLRHVYDITPELVNSEARLLHLLLQVHDIDSQLPLHLINHLAMRLHQSEAFVGWPLAELLSDRSVAWQFLQERWPVYLDNLAGENETRLREAVMQGAYGAWRMAGPILLPFGDPAVRVHIDTLFLEGRLKPIEHRLPGNLSNQWVKVGVRHDPEADTQQKIGQLLKHLESKTPHVSARYQAWLAFAPIWAEALVLLHSLTPIRAVGFQPRFEALQSLVDTRFQAWLHAAYHLLPTLPPHPPVMVHHIPRSLARYMTDKAKDKIALIVLDGMALDQWLVIRSVLQEQLPSRRFEEGCVFTWIPTVTAVSRQALFAGKIPLYFPDSIQSTTKESQHWSRFWEEHGLSPRAIAYEKALRSPADFGKVEEIVANPHTRVVGLVVDQVDQMLHGMTLGIAGLHQQIRLWLQNKFLADLIQRLASAGFQIFITSDHGNIAAPGIGRPHEQALADIRGERVRIYPSETLREHVKQTMDVEAIAWPPVGLPAGFWPLLAPDRQAFALENSNSVTHGGNALEEVIVPFVRVRERLS